MKIEDTKPIDVLADRVWAGTYWHYPHIEKMVAELRELRVKADSVVETWQEVAKERDTARADLATATALLGECEGKVIAAATCSLDATRRNAADDLLTRIRAATKGKT